MRVVFKEPGKPAEIRETNEKYMCDCGSSFIPNGDIRRFGMFDNVYFLYDDEACYKNVNNCFFLCDVRLAHPIQEIRGNVVFCRLKPANVFEEEIWDYEIDEMTDEDIEKAFAILSIDSLEEVEKWIMKTTAELKNIREGKKK